MIASGSPALSFEDLFGSSPENVTVDQLESLLDDVVSKSMESSGRSPRELVRVVDNGVVRWMTAAEAEEHVNDLKGDEDANLKRSVQFALRGDSRILAMEMQVLLTISTGTLNQYRENQLIPVEEITRIESTRKKNPVMGEFEGKMAELLEMQRSGHSKDALPLAQALANMKPRYIRISKALQHDANEGYSVRLDLQQKKKSILSLQRYLAVQREGVLQEESQDLRKKIDNLKVLLQRTVKEKVDAYKSQLGQRETQLDTNQSELEAVQREISYLTQKEKETEGVISGLQETLGVAPTEQPKEERAAQPPAAQEAPQESKQEDAEQAKKKRIRMAIMDQRRG
ncbi:MAG: hypothetical protein P9L94_20425 [Candidatus Hinthialibacter antarcticus]|nr:hypothetical protein [Candidatus Hinthialibacter antarcticus]